MVPERLIVALLALVVGFVAAITLCSEGYELPMISSSLVSESKITSDSNVISNNHWNNSPRKQTNYSTVVKDYHTWCPVPAQDCFNSDVCLPCKRRFLIIIAGGRSASTTLTYMLGSLPGIRMAGENNNELGAIRTLIANTEGQHNFVKSSGMENAWAHNPLPQGAYACMAQHVMETINPPKLFENGTTMEQDQDDVILGFKTIRFLDGIPNGEEAVMVRFVRDHFPCARVVVNIRSDIQAEIISRKKANMVKRSKEAAVAEVRRLRRVASLFGKNSSRLLDSSSWLKNLSELNNVVEWLGYDKSCFFRELLEFNTKNNFQNGKTKLKINPKCRYLYP